MANIDATLNTDFVPNAISLSHHFLEENHSYQKCATIYLSRTRHFVEETEFTARLRQMRHFLSTSPSSEALVAARIAAAVTHRQPDHLR